MQRTVIASIASFVAGLGVGYVLLPDGPERTAGPAEAPGPDASIAASGGAGGGGPLAPRAPDVAERARVYRSVADAGVDELRSMAIDALETSDERGSSFELDAVLARWIEIDPDTALTFAREQNLDAGRMLDVALGVLGAVGYTERSIAEVSARLPRRDRDRFRAMALERLAETDPAQALTLALADATGDNAVAAAGPFGPAFVPWQSVGTQPLRRIGALWAERDPQGALAAIETIGGPAQRLAFAQAVIDRLGSSDPDTVLAYLQTFDVPYPQKMAMMQSAIEQLAMQDPEAALGYANLLGGQLGRTAQMIVVQHWAERDAAAALAYVEAMPAGMIRQNLLQQVASAYARSEPDAALAWARSLGAGQAQAYAGVLAGIAQVDPARALDLALDQARSPMPEAMRMAALMRVISSAGISGSVPYGRLADRVLELENGQARRNGLQMLGQIWVSTDVDGALDWFMNHQEAIGADMMRNLAQQLARQDPQAAALHSARVSPELRGEWISAVATGYAQADPAGARAWVQQFRGEPVYETAVSEVIRFSAVADPAGAATLWGSLPFADAAREAQLASTIAGSWAGQDWQAARNWAASLRPGEVRDSALTGMMSVRQEVPDVSFMALFSSEERRLEAVNRVVMQTAQFDPARAREIVAEYFDEPWRREQAEQMIENIESRQGAMTQSNRFFAPAIGLRGTVVR